MKTSYILRQNKCLHYEAPFIYLFIGDKQTLLIDTGATFDHNQFPLAATVTALLTKQGKQNLPLIVAHSHSHSDHIAADGQFKAMNNTTVIPPKNQQAIMSAFDIKHWPKQITTINLGNRQIAIIPTPGHQKEAITFYDHQTKWLLTSDTFYPGRLYIRQWQMFKQSIDRLVQFSQNHTISAVLGAHIEMAKTAKKDYPTGSTYHPNEASLVLKIEDLLQLKTTLDKLGDQPKKQVLDKFIVTPVK